MSQIENDYRGEAMAVLSVALVFLAYAFGLVWAASVAATVGRYVAAVLLFLAAAWSAYESIVAWRLCCKFWNGEAP